MTLGERLLRALLRILPAEFRGDFAEAMTADLDEARRAGGRRLWTRELPALAATAVREHLAALRDDVKYSIRLMRRTPGFTAMAVVMLALGTGTNAAMFSIVDAVLLRSPFLTPRQLAFVQVRDGDRGATKAVPLDRYAALSAEPGPLAAVAAFGGGSHVITGLGDPMNADNLECVSASMFDALATRPLIGRTLDAADDRAGAAPAIVLSYPFWRQLGGSPSILGTTMTINQTPVTVVGVMPRGFAGPLSRSNVPGWVPIGRPIAGAGNAGCRSGRLVNVVARVQDGMSLAAASAALGDASLTPLESPFVEDLRMPLVALVASVACVLLIACLNVGGLQMERTLARRHEMSLRLALGANRSRLVRQTLTENLLLALTGAIAGVGAARFTLQTIVSTLPPSIPHLAEIEVNGRVLVVSLLAATAAGIASGIAPIAQLRSFSPARDLAHASRAGVRRGWARRALVVAEVGLSIVVLIGAALMIQTFLILRPTQPGFDPGHKWVMTVRLRGTPPEASAPFFTDLLDRLAHTPGITGVAGTTYFPMSGNANFASMALDGTSRELLTNKTTPGYFALMKIPIVAGRTFTADDTRASLPVLIVNELLARRLRADGQVLGTRVPVRFQEGDATPMELTVVGVVANMRATGVDTRPRPEAYVPYAQHPVMMMQIVAEAAPPAESDIAASMRSAVRALRPDLVVAAPKSMLSLLGDRMSTTRFGAWLLGVFAALAVGLAATGLTAAIGWWVSQRTRELGVRVALGATRGQVIGLVLSQGLLLAGCGIAAGCLAAAGLTRYLEGWIYGVAPLDPRTFAACAALMLVVAVCAVCVPVRRALSVDPVVALRTE